LKKSFKATAGLLALLALSITSTSCLGAPISKWEETREMMDTYVRIVVYTDADSYEEVLDEAFARIQEVVDIASTFDAKSQAFKLNLEGSLAAPSDELLEIIEKSIDYNTLSNGYFDITVQPLLDLWSYDPNATTQFWDLDATTQQTAIDEASLLVGSEMINVSADEISFDEDGMEITLGAIAKGYAVDKALETIHGMGVKYALVDAGGDIGTLGSKPKEVPWDISLVNPEDTTQSLASFEIEGQAIATSGNYMRYFDEEANVGHILNPKTGRSATGTFSTTIIAPTCTQADALATAVFVMGPVDGMALVETIEGVEALLVDDQSVIHRSTGLTEN
jgi:thiamine biosynthesis lipoprotein